MFIKDDFSKIGLGDYYLGINGTFSVEKTVFDLIDRCVKELNIRRLIFIGSSKGAYAAMNFGIHYPDTAIIIASPQYRLGTYLFTNPEYQPALEDILGSNITDEGIRMLDQRLEKKIASDLFASTQSLYIHYSVNERSYESHLRVLIADLKKAGLSVQEDPETYPNHWELKYYFPAYLKKTLEEMGILK